MHRLLECLPVNGLCFDVWARASYSFGDGFSVYAILLVEGHQHSHLSQSSPLTIPLLIKPLLTPSSYPRALLLIASTTSSRLVEVLSTPTAPAPKARPIPEGVKTLLLSTNATASP